MDVAVASFTSSPLLKTVGDFMWRGTRAKTRQGADLCVRERSGKCFVFVVALVFVKCVRGQAAVVILLLLSRRVHTHRVG